MNTAGSRGMRADEGIFYDQGHDRDLHATPGLNIGPTAPLCAVTNPPSASCPSLRLPSAPAATLWSDEAADRRFYLPPPNPFCSLLVLVVSLKRSIGWLALVGWSACSFFTFLLFYFFFFWPV